MTSAKAIVGGILSAILAGVSTLATVLVGDATLASVTTGQWLAVLIAVLTTGGAVFGITYSVTNAPAVVKSVAPVEVAPVEPVVETPAA